MPGTGANKQPSQQGYNPGAGKDDLNLPQEKLPIT
jgi:hypothetical protein